MSGYPYNGQPPINPTPPQGAYYAPPTGQPAYPGAPNPYPIGFSPYPGQPGQPLPGHPPPGAMSYPGAPQPSAPAFNYSGYPNVAPQPGYPNLGPQPGYPNVTPQAPQPSFTPSVEWIPSTPSTAHALSDRVVVAGYEGHDGSPIWVIRARFQGDLIPGKMPIKHRVAYVPWGGNENPVQNVEVCCARPEKVRWIETRDGMVPPNAVVAGNTADGEPLYVGRAKYQGSLTPGKVHASHKVLYISFAGQELPIKMYEVLCTV